MVGALCDRIASAGLKVVSLAGTIPKAELSSIRKDFLKIVQESKSAARRTSWLQPSLPNQLIHQRSRSQDILQQIATKPFVERWPDGFHVPAKSPQSVAMVGPRMNLAPGQYRLAWAVSLGSANFGGAPGLSVEIEVGGEVVAAVSLTDRELALPGFLHL